MFFSFQLFHGFASLLEKKKFQSSIPRLESFVIWHQAPLSIVSTLLVAIDSLLRILASLRVLTMPALFHSQYHCPSPSSLLRVTPGKPSSSS